jgi:putative hydrolase of the HAD superfamily
LDFAKAVREIADERGGGIYITTNGVERIQTRRLAESVFAPLADEIFVSETAGHPKPDMRYFDYVFSRIDGFDPALAVIVGDSLTSDIQGGNNAGIFTIWYNPDGNPNDTAAVPDFEAADYDEIIRFIKEH